MQRQEFHHHPTHEDLVNHLRHHHHHHHGPAFGPGFGGMRPGGFGFGPSRGRRRRRRGETRTALLRLLAEAPQHGYGLMQEIEQRSEGRWSPSAGSIYPTLEQLADEGLVRVSDDEGRKRYEITDSGREAVDAAAGAPAPWDPDVDETDDPHFQLGKATMSLAAAVRQVAHAGSQAQQEQVLAMLDESRRRVYAILAGDGA